MFRDQYFIAHKDTQRTKFIITAKQLDQSSSNSSNAPLNIYIQHYDNKYCSTLTNYLVYIRCLKKSIGNSGKIHDPDWGRCLLDWIASSRLSARGGHSNSYSIPSVIGGK